MRTILITGAIVVTLTIGSAFGLKQLRPDLFPIEWALPAAFSYFAQFAVLYWGFSRLRKPIDADRAQKLLDEAKTRKSTVADWLAEIAFFGVFVILGVIAGSLSGIVWWAAGGHTIRTFLEAIKIGALLGGVAILFLFEGG